VAEVRIQCVPIGHDVQLKQLLLANKSRTLANHTRVDWQEYTDLLRARVLPHAGALLPPTCRSSRLRWGWLLLLCILGAITGATPHNLKDDLQPPVAQHGAFLRKKDCAKHERRHSCAARFGR
jgi:hypothetical protein